jgi:hypothetical protein
MTTAWQQTLSPAEQQMWIKPVRIQRSRSLDADINAKYASRELRIVTESNREQLPNFVEALKRPSWMELRPFYQRRARWDPARQSRLIESFIMNIPVPPLFVFESDLAKYEVMDGQQRITAVRDFYANLYPLQGLEQWPELNGRVYEKLPEEIRKGLDRRSISYIVLLKESAETTEEQSLLRQQVFERLNTGGVELSHQEIRNSLYQGRFNDLLLELAKNDEFRKAWKMPPYDESEKKRLPVDLAVNKSYQMMRDVEVVLRFFALRHADQYQRGMKGFLDLYMLRARAFTEIDIEYLRAQFTKAISVATQLYGDFIFRPWKPDEEAWADKPQVAFSDAVMVGISHNVDNHERLISRREHVVEETKRLFEANEPGTFTGRGNTKQDVQDRIKFYEEMLNRVGGE